jgi:transcription elongation factor Elf1
MSQNQTLTRARRESGVALTSVQGVERCPKCNEEKLIYEIELRTGEEWALCEACGFGYQSVLSLHCTDCESWLEEADIYGLRYHSPPAHPDGLRYKGQNYGLPIFKCPNCGSSRMTVELLEKNEPPKVWVLPLSALRPIEELLEQGKSRGSDP